MTAEARGVWVYAVVEDVGDAAGLAGVAGGQVRAIGVSGVTVLAEDVGLDEFGEAALRDKLNDLDWLDRAARAHHRVIEAAGPGPVLPMRLATVYDSDASMAAALGPRAGEFRAAMDRLRERKEWGVKAFPAAGRVRPSADSGQQAGPGEQGAGVAYLRRRRAELEAGREGRRRAAADAEAVHTELAGFAVQARLHPAQAPALSGAAAPTLLNAAYLVDDARAEEFAATVGALARGHLDVRLELTGPWPPYSFAGFT